MSNRRRLSLLGVAALGLSFAFAPFPLRFLSLVALVPLLRLIEKSQPKQAFLYGLFFGTVFFAFHLWWLYTLVVPIEPVTRILLIIGVTLLFVYLGLYVALFALLTRLAGTFWSPLIWVALEFLRSKGEMGFPWGLLGASMTPYLPLIQPASLIGVYGISAWVVLVNLLVEKSFSARKAVFVPLLAITLAVPLVFGRLRMKPVEPWFQVGIIQPNVSPLDKGRAEDRERIWTMMLAQSRSAASRDATLLVYPETSSLIDLTRPSAFRDSLQAIADSFDVPLVIGTPTYTALGYYNSTALITPGRPITDFYHKMHLAPFSERFPFVNKLPFLRRIMTSDMGDGAIGVEPKVFRALVGISGNKGASESKRERTELVRFCTPICFEGIFPDLVREFTSRDAELIVNVTNDGWFGRTPGPYQHCELMIMRAVENGVPFVRSANNGISLIADPYGRIRSRTGLFVAATLTGIVPRPLTSTFYRRNGDQFAYAAVFVTIIVMLVKTIAVVVRGRRGRAAIANRAGETRGTR